MRAETPVSTPSSIPADFKLARYPRAEAMGKPETKITASARQLGISSQTLYRYVSPTGELRAKARKLLARQ